MFDKIIKKSDYNSKSTTDYTMPVIETTPIATDMNDIKKNPLPSSETYRSNGPRPTASLITVLTADAEFKGSLAFTGELQLNGRLEGSIESDGGTLTIGEEALVKADIRVNDIIVYGKVQGNITAEGRIELRGKAHVYGDIRSNRVVVDDGVIFVGRSETLAGKTETPNDFGQIFTRLKGVKANGQSNHPTTPTVSKPTS